VSAISVIPEAICFITAVIDSGRIFLEMRIISKCQEVLRFLQIAKEMRFIAFSRKRLINMDNSFNKKEKKKEKQDAVGEIRFPYH
jgi:hypothetical protein